MWSSIYDQLVDEADNYKVLLSLLKHKQEVIVTGDIKGIQAATVEADLLLKKISELASARHLAVEGALVAGGQPAERPRLTALISRVSAEERPKWQRLADKIRALMEGIYKVTRENATLLETARKMNHSLLNILLPQDQKLNTYDSKGQVKLDNSPERMMNRQV